MLGTIIIDAFEEHEKSDVANALKELLNPVNNPDWSSAGVYCFWNFSTKEVLYIGLAVDLFERFKQHVGLTLMMENKGCKKTEIDAYFLQHKKLGYSIMVQSSLSQPLTYKVVGRYKNKSLVDIGIDGKHSIKYQEGILLQLYKLNHHTFPKWNQVGGAINGQTKAKTKSYRLIQLLTELEPCKYVSRVSIRDLAKNPTYRRFEAYLHSIRISIFPSKQTIQWHQRQLDLFTFSEISESGYFSKRLEL